MSSLSLLVQVSADLREIVTLHSHLIDQAAARAADKDMPGGAAMSLLGPVANQHAFTNRIDGIERYNDSFARWELGLPERDISHFADNEPNEVLDLLTFWTETARENHALPIIHPTISTEALFLSQILNDVFTHNPRFDLLAKDVHTARIRLEAVLRDGIRPTEGIRCPRCHGTELIRTEHDRSRPRGCNGHGHLPACPVLPRIKGRPQQCNCADRGGLIEEWTCPQCSYELDRRGYEQAVFRDYVQHAPYLELKYLHFQIQDVKPGTVKVWASRGHVKTRRNERDEMTYCVADVRQRMAGRAD